MPSVQVNGITIEYEVHGSDNGDPLLLIMGLGGQLTDWPLTFIDELVAVGFRVITPDNRDIGLSTELEGDPPSLWELARAIIGRRQIGHAYLLSDMASDLIAVLDDLGIASAHVAGVSMGGMLTQQIAIDYPERIATMTSIMSTTGNQRVGRAKLRTLLRAARYRNARRSEAVEAAVATFRIISGPTFDGVEHRKIAARSVERSYRPRGTGRQLAAILASGDRTEQLRSVTAPALVIHGLVDPLVQHSGGIATAEAIPNARLIMYPEMGHDIPAGRRAEMAAAIRDNADRSAALIAKS